MEKHLDTEGENLASEPPENQGLQEPEIDLGDKYRSLAFEQINAFTWKLTDGKGSLAWNGDRSGSYRTPRALAWLMAVGASLWVVRYRNASSKPMKLPKAKTYALEIVKGIRPGRVVDDPIGRLHRLHLDALEPMPSLSEVWAIETADYPPLTPSPVLVRDDQICARPDGEVEDGYPILPDCLRRTHE